MDSGKIVVLTGNGKGKTTSALGIGFKHWIKGKRVLVLQFIKGERQYGELVTAANLNDNFTIKQMGKGFVKGADEEVIKMHQQYANTALNEALRELKSGKNDIIVLDEINYAVHFNLISEEQVLELLNQKPDNVILLLTGRYARDNIINKADEVYEFKDIKHYATVGMLARKGIEF